MQNRSDSSVVLGHNAVVLRLVSLRQNSLSSSDIKHLFDMAPHMARRRGSFYEELGAGDPVGAGAETSAALGLIRTAGMAICKRAPIECLAQIRGEVSSRRSHHEWLIRI